MHTWCQERDIVLVMQYMPAYSQIYYPNVKMAMRDLLARWCDERNLFFHDLTLCLRAGARTQILYLAPVDWHLNPTGYQVVSDAVADYLIEKDLVPDASNTL